MMFETLGLAVNITGVLFMSGLAVSALSKGWRLACFLEFLLAFSQAFFIARVLLR